MDANQAHFVNLDEARAALTAAKARLPRASKTLRQNEAGDGFTSERGECLRLISALERRIANLESIESTRAHNALLLGGSRVE